MLIRWITVYRVSVFPILPRSPESLSSFLICNRSTIPEIKRKKSITLEYGNSLAVESKQKRSGKEKP